MSLTGVQKLSDSHAYEGVQHMCAIALTVRGCEPSDIVFFRNDNDYI